MLGTIKGRSTTKRFTVTLKRPARTFEYVQVEHPEAGKVLAQITEIIQDDEQLAKCAIIGTRKAGKLTQLRSPLPKHADVELADDAFVASILAIDAKAKAFIGKLEARDVKVHLDLNRLLTKHMAILAKTGAGKSYTAAVLLEEILESKVPLLIIDPHGEYGHLGVPNEEQSQDLKAWGLKPKGYEGIVEYGDQTIDPHLQPIRLSERLTAQELGQIVPAKLSPSQRAVLYATVKDLPRITLTGIIDALAADQDLTNLNLLSVLDYLKSLGVFSDNPLPLSELIRKGRCSIINLKGMAPEVQEIVVTKLLSDLFEERKRGAIPPFFTVIEEAHNFCPERNFREARSSQVIRTIASEGRKFGMGLCVISQRPARLDKNVLSQCGSQIILKVTNPNDLRSITASLENVTAETEDEIKQLPVGMAMVTGVLDMPLLIRIRPRKSAHGGDALDIIGEIERQSDHKTLPVVGKVAGTPVLIPALLLTTAKGRFLVETVRGHLIPDPDQRKTVPLPDAKLSPSQAELLERMRKLRRFDLVKLNEVTRQPVLKLRELLDLFKTKGLLEQEGAKYRIAEGAALLADPQKYATDARIERRPVEARGQLQAKLRTQDVLERAAFLGVEKAEDCFVPYTGKGPQPF